jgi:alanyl-tRNA synthetase
VERTFAHSYGGLPFLIFDFRHVSKTGEIKDFVITEETAIAKGIRRIVAVTGHEAADVESVARQLGSELDAIERLSGKEKETAMKQYTVVSWLLLHDQEHASTSPQKINQADISVLRKATLKDRLAKLQKAFSDEAKLREKAAIKLVSLTCSLVLRWLIASAQSLDKLNEHFTTTPDAVGYFASVELDGNIKSMGMLVAQARKLNKAVYLISVDSQGKVVHVNFVPKEHISSKFDARSWSEVVTDVIGGRVSAVLC